MKGTIILTVAAWCALPLLALAQDAKPKEETKRKGGTVPIEILQSKHIAVQIKVNDKGPFRVIFDTGAPVTLVSNKLAAEADLLTEKEKKSPALFGTRGQKRIKKLEVAGLTMENTDVMVMDHPLLKVASKVLGPLDGIVGFPFFSEYKMTIDYATQTMHFEPTDYKSEGGYMAMVMGMMFDDGKPKKKLQSPTTLWGFTVKDGSDTESGLDVAAVVPQSPAAAAGLKVGDRLLVLDGTWTDTIEDCYRAATGAEPGQKVAAKVQRDGKEVDLTIVPKLGL